MQFLRPRRAGWPPDQPSSPPSLAQCLTLALLLHVLAVLLIGTVPGGSAPRGEGVWGSLSVTLRGLRAEPGSGTPQAETPTGPAGRALQPRVGGTVRPIETPPADAPGAAVQAPWQPVEAPALPDTAAPPLPPLIATDPAPAPAPAAAPEPAPPLPPRSEPVLTAPPLESVPLTVPRIDPVPTTPRTTEARPLPATPAAPPAPARPPTPVPAPPPVTAPVTPRAAEPEPEPPTPALPAVPLRAPPAPLDLKPDAARASLPAADVPLPALRPSPVAPPEPLPSLPSLPTPALRPPPAEALRPQAPALKPPEAAELPPVPVQPTAAPAMPAAAPAAAAPTAPAPPVAAQPERLAPSRTAPPGSPPAPATSTPSPEPARSAAPSPAAPPQPAQGGAKDVDLFGRPVGPAGTPDGGPRVGHDVATPPSVPPSAPRLNLDAPRPARGPELSRQASPSVLNLMPPPPERKSKLAADIENAGKADCKKAYAGLGLLAVVPLAVDAVRDKGCKW